MNVTHMNESCHTHEWVLSNVWMSHIWMSHVTHMNECCQTYDQGMSHVWMSHVTHMHESYHTYEWVTSHMWIMTSLTCMAWSVHVTSHVTHMNDVHRHVTHINNIHMGWLRLVGSLKWQVSFAEYCLFYRALLQKRPIILRSLLIVATP